MFRKYDGGIRVCSRKTVLNRNVFLTTPIKLKHLFWDGIRKEAPLIIKDLTVGPIMANCYIVGCEETKSAAVIDPGDEADRILMVLAEAGLTVKTIINTHGHFDHVSANQRMKEVTGAELLIHATGCAHAVSTVGNGRGVGHVFR